MAIPRVLVVDDDPEMRGMMVAWMQRNGFAAVGAATGAEVAAQMAAGRVDLILLDVMLGDDSGVEICRRLRAEQEVPIIMVSALSADHQRMEGYRAGADDYVAKPFNPDLLVERVRAVLRRTRRASSLAYRRRRAVWQFGGWTFDARSTEVRAPGGYQVALSSREAQLLQVFLANPEIPLTREEIAEGMDITGDTASDVADGRAIDVLVGRLRAKIEEDPKAPQLIRTARGVGYILAVPVMVEAAS